MQLHLLLLLLDEKLVDFVAMDIKNSLENYHKACGRSIDLERIELSVNLIRFSGVPYEFRTTVVPGIHTEKDFEAIGEWLDGVGDYALQEYRDEGKILNEEFMKKQTKEKLDLKKLQKKLQKKIKRVVVR